MTTEEYNNIKNVCIEVVNERIKFVQLIFKWSTYSLGIILALLIPLWYFFDGFSIYRKLHNEAFPVVLKMEPDTVLITAYSKEFVLKRGDPSLNESGYLTFYAEPGQKVKYLISAQHRFFSDDSKRRKFFVEVDGFKLYDGQSIVEHGGGLRITPIRQSAQAESEINLHKFGFRLDMEQVNYDVRDEVFISCVILVFGKQYKL